jgi:hypothetical protein
VGDFFWWILLLLPVDMTLTGSLPDSSHFRLRRLRAVAPPTCPARVGFADSAATRRAWEGHPERHVDGWRGSPHEGPVSSAPEEPPVLQRSLVRVRHRRGSDSAEKSGTVQALAGESCVTPPPVRFETTAVMHAAVRARFRIG